MFGVIRLIILGFLIAIALKLYRKFQQNRLTLLKKETHKKDKAAPKKMVQCDHCGIYIPSSEAIRDGDKIFCCKEHQVEKAE